MKGINLTLKSNKCVFLGYGSDVKGYRLYNLSNNNIIHSRDVIFNESDRISFEKELLDIPKQLSSNEDSNSKLVYVDGSNECSNADSDIACIQDDSQQELSIP